MTAPAWSAGHLYIPGDIVQPASGTPTAGAAIVNPNVTGSATGWSLTAPWVYDAGTSFTPGSGALKFDVGFTGFASFNATAGIPVNPGTVITASCQCQQGASSAGNLGLNVQLFWYTSADAFISNDAGNVVNDASGGEWKISTVTGTAPANAAYVRIGASGNRIAQNLAAWVDNFVWDYVNVPAPSDLVFRAVQANPGLSGPTEPSWPAVLGLTVVDHQVTWEAIAATRITWQASPILESGAVEPTWPTTIGGTVADGSIVWEAFPRRVEDVNCPNTKVVAIVGSKVHAADRDIGRFCATANPLDWTSERDAGYLPLGLQQANANDFNGGVFNQYRGNLVAFNASSFQNWQADPDPAAMALLDQMDGIGSTWQQAAQPVANDLFYLAALGVRTVGIAGASTNLQAGDVGMPIDPLVQGAVRNAIANGSAVRSAYYPAAGQYLLAFTDYPPGPPSIVGNVPDGATGSTGSGAYVVSGGNAPYGAITVTDGTPPPGLTINPDGTYSYAYTTNGTYAFTVGGVDAAGVPFSTPDTVVVTSALTLTGDFPNQNLGDGAVFAYGATGGVGAVTYALHSGSLPGGRTLNADGTVTGISSVGGSFSWVVRGTDAFGNIDDHNDSATITSYALEVLADNPLYYLRLGESSGSTAFDSAGLVPAMDSGYLNSPTLGVTGLIPGDPNTAVDFDGTTQRVDMPHNGRIDVPQYTIECVLVPDTVSGGVRHIVNRDHGIGTNRIFQLRQNNAACEFTTFDGAPISYGLSFGSMFAVDTKVVIHVRVNTATGECDLWKNGTMVDSDDFPALAFAAAYGHSWMGDDGGISGGLFDGTADELAFYGSLLSPDRMLLRAQLLGLA